MYSTTFNSLSQFTAWHMSTRYEVTAMIKFEGLLVVTYNR